MKETTEVTVICPTDAFEGAQQYLTAGRKYQAEQRLPGLVILTDDTGMKIMVRLRGSSHTGDLLWQVVEEKQP